jgi:hypothetical protein
MTETDLKIQMESIGAAPDYREILMSDPGQPEKMARALGRTAVEVGAREAQFARFKNLVWARLTGKRGKVDIMFRMNRVLAELRPEKSEFFEDVIAVAG